MEQRRFRDWAGDVQTRAREEAVYLVEKSATVRATAARFGVSKSTVHKDVTERLGEGADPALRQAVLKVLRENKAERHLRGGEATRRKYRLAGGKRK